MRKRKYEIEKIKQYEKNLYLYFIKDFNLIIGIKDKEEVRFYNKKHYNKNNVLLEYEKKMYNNGKSKLTKEGRLKCIVLVTNEVTKGSSGLSCARIVADLFIPNPHNHNFIKYKDGYVDNVNLSNLEWTDTATPRNGEYKYNCPLVSKPSLNVKQTNGISLLPYNCYSIMTEDGLKFYHRDKEIIPEIRSYGKENRLVCRVKEDGKMQYVCLKKHIISNYGLMPWIDIYAEAKGDEKTQEEIITPNTDIHEYKSSRDILTQQEIDGLLAPIEDVKEENITESHSGIEDKKVVIETKNGTITIEAKNYDVVVSDDVIIIEL